MLGRFLFRWRGVIGFAAFCVVFLLARPTFESCLLGFPIILVGLATRFWASGHIGIEGRAREIGASSRLVSGPYRLLRHPLYIGNFTLVVGMLVALRPAAWLAIVVLAGFVAEYTLIVVAEEAHLLGLGCNAECRVQNAERKMAECEVGSRELPGAGGNAECRMQNAKGKMEEEGIGGKPEARRQKPKGRAEEGEQAIERSQKLDARCQMSEARSGEERMANGDSFSPVRALVEWRTWVVTGVAWGLAMVKAAIAD